MSVMHFCFNAQLATGDIAHTQRILATDRVRNLLFTSLFTDARASADLLEDSELDAGGAWSDLFHPGGRGSLLWTLRTRKITTETLALARTYALNAIRWMEAANEVKSIDDVVAEKTQPNRCDMRVFYTDLNGVKQEFVRSLNLAGSDGI